MNGREIFDWYQCGNKILEWKFSREWIKFIDLILDESSAISFITDVATNKDDELIYDGFVSNSVIITISPSIIEHTINIRKVYRLKLPDAFIVATALVNDFTFLADNDKDFLKIKNWNT